MEKGIDISEGVNARSLRKLTLFSRKSDITTEGQWTHDLHDTVARDDPPTTRHSHVPTYSTYSNKNIHTAVRTAPSTTPPNRQFGGSVIVGNVPVVVYIPGMDRPVTLPPAVKRQHTLLPQHRPPLRRDKPVRVSLPNSEQPGYVFPSLDRSFIFIPRAMRPNQQSYRGRGRGGFFGGRRPSIYGNSTYTPSVAMSRRSSFGKPPSQDGYHSPAASVASRHTVVTTENGKPVVRLPPPRPPGAMPAAAPVLPIPPITIHPQPQTQTQQPIWRESRPAPIPMHQPRPQKAVSLADIETPASFPVNPPPAQQEQPFHHQVPYGPDASASYPPPAHTAATPLSQIPERAANVPPFQLYGFQQPQPYYPGPYQAGPAYYPVAGTEYAPYNNSGTGPGAPFPTGQNVPYMVSGTHTPSEPPSQGGTVAHESNGTVYYLDASQMYPGSPFGAPPTGGPVGMGGMMAPSTTYYYPQPQGGYYPPQ
jgi:next-to-BRCA1 protein 1